MKNSFRNLILLIIISFFLHLAWEYLHLPFYTGYEHLSSTIPIPVWATIGDVAYTLGAILLVSLFKGNLTWFREARMKDYIGLAILGFCIALFVEYKAVVFHRWYYTNRMPIISLLNVGLSPILQMTILLPLSVFLTKTFSRIISK